MSEFKFPTEEVELPSKGLIYSKDNPLSSGKVEVKYMTAKEEDILSNQSFIQKGVVLEKLLQSVIINKDIKLDDLIVGDKNALLIATRILGYGKDYDVEVKGQNYTLDMSTLENKEFDESEFEAGKNEFSFTTPATGTVLTYQLATGKLEKQIDRELAGLKKISKENSPELTTRLKYLITSVDGNEEKKEIREFVDNRFLARDSRAFRDHIASTQPDVNLSYILDNGEEVTIPIGLNFFWPDYN
ncbi:hypothetical protein N9034_00400 [bacterium]|nr:hypothetical protein [bacterium]MDB4489622.1 hypothetical protein [bacterium]